MKLFRAACVASAMVSFNHLTLRSDALHHHV